MSRTRKRWAAAIGAALLLASLTSGGSAAAAGSTNRGGLGATEQRVLPFGLHAPSAAERRAMPAALRASTTAVSGPYHLYNRNSGDVLEVYQSSTSNGAKVDQWTNNGSKTQKWMMAPDSLNLGYVFWNVNSLKCLDNTGRLADGVQMIQWTCGDGNHNQIFLLRGTDHGYVNIAPYDGRGTYCVEVYHSSFADGAPVDEWHCNGTWTQQWIRYAA